MTRVAQNGDGVADLVDLVQVVADEQERDTLLLQAPDAAEEALDPGPVEPGGGLVEDDEAGSERESARDLDELALLDGQVAGEPVDVDVERPLVEQRVRLRAQLTPVDRAEQPTL